MPVRLDQLPRDTQQQIFARLEEQGLLVREQPKQEPASDQPSRARRLAIIIGYAVAVLGVAFLALLQASGTDASSSYPAFFARVFVYVVKGCWAIVRDNAVPLSGNLVIVAIFLVGIWKALELAFWVVRKLWPLLLLAEVAFAVLQLQAALGRSR
jgi:lysylphosphatidylglycerol synthetase-like protein (DUF2156 family)